MARYIDADKLYSKVKEETNPYGKPTLDYESGVKVLDMINNQPTADVVEVKHGEWYLLDECANEGVYCSVCHKKVYKTDYANQKLKSKFCPNCGARMEVEET